MKLLPVTPDLWQSAVVVGRAKSWGATRLELWFHYLLQVKAVTSQSLVSCSVKRADNPYLTVYHVGKQTNKLESCILRLEQGLRGGEVRSGTGKRDTARSRRAVRTILGHLDFIPWSWEPCKDFRQEWHDRLCLVGTVPWLLSGERLRGLG